MEIFESHPRLGQRWRVSLAPAQQNRIENRPESKSERLLAAFGADCSREATAQAQLPYAIALPSRGGEVKSARNDVTIVPSQPSQTPPHNPDASATAPGGFRRYRRPPTACAVRRVAAARR